MNNLFKLIISIIFLFCIFGSQDPVHAASKEKLVKKGNTFFSSGKYDEAITAYDEAAVEDPESPYIYFNKGTALYKKEDYSAARDAFGQAALKSKDLVLESKSKFNLGLCFFREGERQKDSDLKKTLESYGHSVQSFQEALDLDSKFVEAAENIEMVRLMMKLLLDEIKRQEEEAKKQQEQAKKIAELIKNLIEQQDALLKESQALLTDPQFSKQLPDAADKLSEKNQILADAQDQLKQETQNLSQQLSARQSPGALSPAPSSAPVPQPQSQPEHPSKQHLDDAAVTQDEAVQNFSKNDTQTGANQQEKSLEALNKALDALKSDQNHKSGQQQQQQGDQQQSNQQKKDQEDPNKKDKDKDSQPSGEKKQNENSKTDEQQAQAMKPTEDADSILDEEKENKKQRIPYSPGGFKEVDKDW